MASSDKSKFSLFQSTVTVLTPVMVLSGSIWGFLLERDVTKADDAAQKAQAQIAAIQTSIKSVEAMETYFKMMGGDNNAEAKMAAYALYMLNKGNPEMTVSMIMAPEKEDLLGVLIDLGSRDSDILREVQKILESQDDTRKGTSMQQTAQKIIGDIGSSAIAASAGEAAAPEEAGGWSYLGNFDAREDMRFDVPGGALPVEGQTYTLDMDVNLRSDYPNSANGYKSGSITGVARTGEKIVIIESKPDKKKRVWARISVVSQ